MENHRKCVCIFIAFIVLTVKHCHGDVNGTTESMPSMQVIEMKQNCSLNILEPNLKAHVKELVEGEGDLVRYLVTIVGDNSNFNKTLPGDVYQPCQWVIAAGNAGKSMLMLKDYFDPMSLHTLGYGVDNVNVTIIQQPENCLEDQRLNVTEIENYLRLRILNNFEDDREDGLADTVAVCNRHFTDYVTGNGKLIYVCCQETLISTLQCSELKENIWITYLFDIIIALQVLLVLFCPTFLSKSMFKLNNRVSRYIYSSDQNEPLKLCVQKLNPGTVPRASFQKTTKQWFTELASLKSYLDDMVPGKVKTFNVKEVKMCIRRSKLIPEGYSPVTIMSFLSKFFFRCKMRKAIPSIGACCSENTCKLFPCKLTVYWYTLLKFIMLATVPFVVASPWLARVWFYYEHEHDIISYQNKAIRARNLTMPWTGNLVTYLTPTHLLFKVIYLILGVEVILYVIVPEVVKRKLKFTIRKCFYDMQATPKLDACGLFVSGLVFPLKKLGIVGVLAMPFWILLSPLLLLILAVQVLPIVNVSSRLFFNFVYYLIQFINPQCFCNLSKWCCPRLCTSVQSSIKSVIIVDKQEKNIRGNKLTHTLALAMSFVSLWLVLILAVECISFYVECAVYIVIGIILNPGSTMKYVSLLILVGFYGYDCLYSVNKRYAAFHTTVHSEIKKLVNDKIKNIAMLSEEEQENIALVLSSTNEQTRMRLVAGSEGYLKWYKPRLLIFLDKTDIPYIPKAFILKFAKFPYFACPGPVHLLYLKALFDFSMILIFLMFVFVVILAFGQANDMTSGTQALAAMAGGFLPLVFRKFLFQTQGSPSLDTSKLCWQSIFRDAQENCVPRYNFSDIIVEDADINNSVPDIEISTRPIEETTHEDYVTNPQIVHEMLLPIKHDETESSEDSEVDLVVVPRPDGNSYDFFVPMFASFDENKLQSQGKNYEEEIDETIV